MGAFGRYSKWLNINWVGWSLSEIDISLSQLSSFDPHKSKKIEQPIT